MRNLLRTRKQFVREQSSHVLRVQKTLEDANIKLDSVLTDLMGKSGRAVIEALIAGETNPVRLAGLADRRVKASSEEFREALGGRVTKHHRFLLRLHLNQINALDAAMATLDAQVEVNLGPFRTAVELIGSVPGIKNLGAQVIVSEIGRAGSLRPGRRRLYPYRHLPHAQDGTMYNDLGRNQFDRRSSDQQKKRLVKRLADLGYAVEIKPLAATA